MESLPSVEMQDYWDEVHTLRGGKSSFSEEDKSQDDMDDDDLDTTFFESLGMSVSNSSQELSEENVSSNKFMGTLTTRQEEALKRRVQTLNATLRQKRHRNKTSKPDIRNFFSSNDASSTGTRSRSATPDSLDSVSPPHTPPDPNPKTWVDPYLSRSRGSLDSGNHSLVTVPCYQPSSPTLVTVSSYQPSPTLVTVTNYHQPSSSSSSTAYDNGATSIVTVSSSRDGSTSPLSSDANEGLGGSSGVRYRDSSTQCSLADTERLQDCNNKYKFSRTYITNDESLGTHYDHHRPFSQVSVKPHELDQKDKGYADDTQYSSVQVHDSTSSRSYSHRRDQEKCLDYRENRSYAGDRSPDAYDVSVSPYSDQRSYRDRRSSRESEGRVDVYRDDRGDRGYRGHHSPQTDQSVVSSPPSHRAEHSPHHRYVHYPEGRVTVLPRAPSLDGLVDEGDHAPPPKGAAIRRQRSYARDIARDVKFYYAKGVYELKPQTYHSEDRPHDVQVLRYQHIGSMHIPRCREGRPPLAPDMGPPSRQNTEESSSSESSGGLASPLSSEESSHSQPVVTRDKKTSRETRPRTASATDFGFKIMTRNEEGKFPELELEVGRGGQTRMDWLNETDLDKLKSLALLELEIIFADHHISHSWKNGKKKKVKDGDGCLFGASLSSLLQRDNLLLPDSCPESVVPQLVVKLVSQLEVRGLQEEGILRVPGNSAKTETLRALLDTNFYSRPQLTDEALRAASPNDLVAVLKLFLRSLPEPLLTGAHLPAFHKAHRVEPLEDRVVALTMLLLLLPVPYRDTLRVLLDLCGRVIDEESRNRMGLANVATIMAPNLFPPKSTKEKVKSDQKDQLLEYARSSCELTQMLIKYREVLWTVPHRLLGQIRRQYQASTASKPISRILTRKHKEPQRPVDAEHGPQSCTARVVTPQFTQQQHTITLNHSLTVQQLLARLIEAECQRGSGGQRVEGRREQQLTGGSCVRHPPPLQSPTTCLLRGPKHALSTHDLHERGGNICDRRLDKAALLLAVMQDNPNALLIVHCHHPGGHPVGG